jgi:hypothetical protein
VSVTEPPAQNVVAPLAEMVGAAGNGFTTTLVGADVAVQPLASVTVTVYAPDMVGAIAWVVSPLDHA